MSVAALSLGAPGIYSLPDEPIRALTGARMDVCAFVGVAPRGPARPPRFLADWADAPCDSDRADLARSIAVSVESFDAYRRLFGGFEGPGLLPYAVASFFEQGGQRAYIVRVVHDYLDPVANAARVASAELPLTTSGLTKITLRARGEGSWGNRLTATLSFDVHPLQTEEVRLGSIIVPADIAITAGTLLRLTLSGGARVLRFASSVDDEWHPSSPRKRRVVTLEFPVGAIAAQLEVVEAALEIDDGDGRHELHDRIGLSSLHPRWLASVLYQDSILVYPQPEWIDGDIAVLDSELPSYAAPPFAGGEDRYQDIVHSDFFDPDWVLGDSCPGAGIHAVIGLPDLGMLAVPDLYSPGPLVSQDPVLTPVSLAGPTFERCVVPVIPAPQASPPAELVGLQLDPEIPGDLDTIVDLQSRVVSLADDLQSFVALLDVPPRLHQRRILQWRAHFGSAYAATYHPWLRVSRADDARNALIRVPPSAVAAGIIAQREIAFGIPYGPANVIAAGVVDLDDRVSPARHDELHPLGVNVFLRERDGVRLSAARTLGRDPAYRQLSVRRLVTMLRRTLDQQMQWAVFEPNNASLRADVKQLLRTFLRELYRANAFRGATEDEAFFVRCDEDLNPQRVIDAGQLIVEIGVAPAEPLEFIVLRVARGGDGTIRVEG